MGARLISDHKPQKGLGTETERQSPCDHAFEPATTAKAVPYFKAVSTVFEMRRPRFAPLTVHIICQLNEVLLVHVSLRVLRFSPVSYQANKALYLFTYHMEVEIEPITGRMKFGTRICYEYTHKLSNKYCL
jgi:hypothetical protein